MSKTKKIKRLERKLTKVTRERDVNGYMLSEASKREQLQGVKYFPKDSLQVPELEGGRCGEADKLGRLLNIIQEEVWRQTNLAMELDPYLSYESIKFEIYMDHYMSRKFSSIANETYGLNLSPIKFNSSIKGLTIFNHKVISVIKESDQFLRVVRVL